ncbi:MAG: amino acid adenylation domain-containing protein [Candidatus Eremiobacteraeota bacterium]|nr:amino acid adenylation domain-containing protein [Candidatus Eremiobacteraeota bacterium]
MATSGSVIARRAADGPAPLSFAQELIWLMDRASPGITAWNVARAWRIHGPLDLASLQAAFDALSARHEALRTIFTATDDGPRAVVRAPQPVPIARFDLSDYAEHGPAEAERLVREQAQTPFDLANQVPLRVMLVRLGDQDWILSVDTHHIVSDSWSKSIVSRELGQLYASGRRGTTAALPVIPLTFSDFAAWERDAGHTPTLAASLAYWRAQLADAPAALDLPVDRPRAAAPRFAGAGTVAILPPDLLDGIKRLARANDATLYMTLLAAFTALLARYSGQDDVVVGSPIAGRSQSETEGVVGYFANTLVLRTRLDGEPTFAQLLARVRATCLEAYEHQEVPAEQLILELQKGGQLTQAPLFQVILAMEDTLPDVLSLDGLKVRALDVDLGATKFDLTLRIAEVSDGLRLSLWYRTDLFLEGTAQRLLSHLRTLLAAAVADPTRPCRALPLLSEAERHALLVEHNATTAPIGPAAVHAQFEAAVRRSPQAAAVVDDARTYTYAALNAEANRLAHRLLARGVEAGQPVGLALPRSARAVAALLGVLKAGAAFVPLDPALPEQRLAALIAESGVRLVVGDSVSSPRLGGSGVATVDLDGDDSGAGPSGGGDPGLPISLEGTAYVVFTSGSTGVPKGVAVSHRNLLNYATAISARLGASRSDPWTFATVSPLWVDLGYTAVFPALCSGGTLHVIGDDVALDAARFAARMTTAEIDVLKITPTHLAALSDRSAMAGLLPRRWLVLGGEACPWNLAERAAAAGTCAVLNHYGPTETTVGACTFALGERDFGDLRPATVPIGRPLGNVRCYVLDAAQQPLPPGIPGELYIGGMGVAAGYVNRPAVSAERFIPDPFGGSAGGRLYRTGDRVRRLPSGELEFLGRLDDQVKVRGFRVELGEIESVLAQHPLVGQAAAVLRGAGGEARVAAYVVPRSSPASAPPDAGDVRTWLAERLPDYMVPDAFVVVERLPLGPSGKVDRSALPHPDSPEAEGGTVSPRTPTEERIAAIWAELLGVERVGVTTNFLTLGFHSILAIRGLNELNRAFGVRVPLRSFFDSPTVGQLAAVVDAEVAQAEEREFERALREVEQC